MMDELDDVSAEHLGLCCETGKCETCSECGRDLAWTMDGRRVCDNQLCSVAIAEWRRNDDARKAALDAERERETADSQPSVKASDDR